jgi:hypothetical protein
LSFSRSRIAGVIAVVAAVAGVGNAVEGTLNNPDTVSHAAVISLYGGFDEAFAAVRPRAKRILLQFENFDDSDAGDTKLVSILFFRAVYTMYPSRVGLGEPSAVLFSNEQIIGATHLPIEAWTGREPVDAVLHIRREGKYVLFNPVYTQVAGGQPAAARIGNGALPLTRDGP